MDKLIKVRRPGLGVGDTHEQTASFDLPSFDLYGRHHEVTDAETRVRVTQLAEGLHLDFEVVCKVSTTCDRTLEPLELALGFGESEFLEGPNDPELYVEDWEMNVSRYAMEALPSEVPMQVFRPGTEPVKPESEVDEIDPRWRALGDLFASGF
ncbi:hypothetical protein BH24ACT19_BH24ACT19_03930 [soil metagenome]|jgi:uncharacterized metal-binding protein YceD (DUF177 family)